MSLILTLLFLIAPQTMEPKTISGRVVDASTGELLAYVNIGVMGTSSGTVSDEKGYFELSVANHSSEAKLKFSMVGYKFRVFKLSELSDEGLEIALEKDLVELEQINVTKSRLKEDRMGGRSDSKKMVTGWGKRVTGSERGLRIKIKEDTIFVKSLHFHIANNELDTVLLRLHIRDIVNDIPNEELLSEDILIPVSKKSGWIEADLEAYNLSFDHDIAVTLQPVRTWGECKTDYCLTFSLGMFKYFSTDWLYYKDGSEGAWLTKKNWTPGIYLTVWR